ncbi:hypothetical protein [Motilimonas sp. KMU-193]|uniref:hypothetical protein n=1 Tax=Motilimonas sp. KMU-193 TaxID=3388668 RepID=UPI00396B1B13
MEDLNKAFTTDWNAFRSSAMKLIKATRPASMQQGMPARAVTETNEASTLIAEWLQNVNSETPHFFATNEGTKRDADRLTSEAWLLFSQLEAPFEAGISNYLEKASEKQAVINEGAITNTIKQALDKARKACFELQGMDPAVIINIERWPRVYRHVKVVLRHFKYQLDVLDEAFIAELSARIRASGEKIVVKESSLKDMICQFYFSKETQYSQYEEEDNQLTDNELFGEEASLISAEKPAELFDKDDLKYLTGAELQIFRLKECLNKLKAFSPQQFEYVSALYFSDHNSERQAYTELGVSNTKFRNHHKKGLQSLRNCVENKGRMAIGY